MAEWTIASDSKSDGLWPTGVRIPLRAHEVKTPFMRVFTLLWSGDSDGKGVGEMGVSPWRSSRTDGFVGVPSKVEGRRSIALSVY